MQQIMADSVLAIWIAFMFLRHGLGDSLREDALRFAPSRTRPILAWMCADHSGARDSSG
jgi:hypothetical protein